MSEQGVKRLMGRLVSDDKYRASFFKDPAKAVAYGGYALDAHELGAVSKLKATDLVVNLVRRPGGGASPVASYELDVRSAKI